MGYTCENRHQTGVAGRMGTYTPADRRRRRSGFRYWHDDGQVSAGDGATPTPE